MTFFNVTFANYREQLAAALRLTSVTKKIEQAPCSTYFLNSVAMYISHVALDIVRAVGVKIILGCDAVWVGR
jgi:hypothetical protein